MGFQIQFPDSVGEWLLWTTIHGSFLVVFVLFAQWALQSRLSARWRFALWWPVVLRLLMPVSVESDLSLFNLWPHKAGFDRTLGAVTEPPSVMPKPPEADLSAPVDQDGAPMPAAGEKTESGTQVSSANETHSNPPQVTAPSLAALVGRIWLLGTGAMAILLIASALLQYRKLRFQPWIRDQRLTDLLAKCKREMGVRRHLDLVQAPAASTPALYGLFRPWLLLPRHLHRELSTERLRHVFLHELAHLKRGDIAVNWLGALLLLVHWFNPFVWLAVVRMRTDCELAADEHALSFVEENENQSYGETILGILKRATQAPPVPGLVGIVETNKPLKRRIQMIANFRTPASGLSLAPIAGMSAVGALTLLSLTTASNGKSPSMQTPIGMDPYVEQTRVEQCKQNLKEIGLAVSLFTRDNDGKYPASFGQLMSYAPLQKRPEVLVCPSDQDGERAASSEALDPEAHSTYELLSGSVRYPGKTLAACPIHGQRLTSDLSVDQSDVRLAGMDAEQEPEVVDQRGRRVPLAFALTLKAEIGAIQSSLKTRNEDEILFRLNRLRHNESLEIRQSADSAELGTSALEMLMRMVRGRISALWDAVDSENFDRAEAELRALEILADEALTMAKQRWGSSKPSRVDTAVEEEAPEHDGRSVHAWIEELESRPGSQEAEDTLAAMGNDALPFLAEAVAKEGAPRRLRARSIQIIERIGRSERWRDPFSDSKPSPELVDAVAAIAEVLNGEDADLRRMAAQSLAFIGPSAAPAVPELTALVASGSPDEQKRAAMALGSIGTAASAAVPVLNKLLEEGTPEDVRKQVLQALRSFGPASQEALPNIVENLHNEELKRAAAQAVATIGRIPDEARPKLERMLQEQDESVQTAAAVALWHSDSNHETAKSIVLESLQHPDEANRRSATASLVRWMGPKAKEAVPVLTGLLTDEYRMARIFAFEALENIAPEVAEEKREELRTADRSR